MNPLSPITYYLRHRMGALVQIALITLATVGLFVLVGVLDTVPLRANVSYLTKLSRVVPTAGTLDPAVVSQIQTHPDVARVIRDNGLWIAMPSLLGTDTQHLLGVSLQDAQYLMQHCGVRIKQGRMFEPRTNEFVLSEEVARALNLELGSKIGRDMGQGVSSLEVYEAVAAPLVLVGILEGSPTTSPVTGREVSARSSVRLGFVSAEYLESHEQYAPRTTNLLVVAAAGRKAAVDDFLETAVSSRYTEVETFAELLETIRLARIGVYVIVGVVNSVVAVTMAFVVGIINRIAIAKRLSEFGLLHALGHPKERLIRRLTLETAAVAAIGCLIGLGTALTAMGWLKNSLFYDLGMEMNLLNPAPFCFVLPIPVIVVTLTLISVRRVFARLDAVAIVERGELSEEPEGQRAVQGSSARPLSSLTFYLRHQKRGMLMILGPALMVLGITFPVFLLSAMTSAMRPYMEYLEHVSVVSPVHTELDPGVVGDIRGQPAVARAIQAIPLGMQMILPPGGGTDVRIYGVSEADLPILIELFGVQVQEGHLPRPSSNEIVLSAAIAANRGLRVGDVVGGETDADNALVVDDLPTEMVVAGILSPDRPWTGFASYEYLRSHELASSRSPHLLIIPHAGQKQALDSWLEENTGSAQANVITHKAEEREYKEMTTSLVLTFALLECMIAAVATVAMATLNVIFFGQRKEEFGVLNTIGCSRRWLVGRTIRETCAVTALAWLIGAGLCGVGLAGMQTLLYAPRGLTLDFFNVIPWAFTAPLPLSIIFASALTVGRMLHKLDPVAIIERR